MKKYYIFLVTISLSLTLTGCLSSSKTTEIAKVQPTPAISPVNPCQTNANSTSDCDEVYDIDTQGYPYYPDGNPKHRTGSIRYYPVGHPLHNDKTMSKTRPTLNPAVKITEDLPKILVSRTNPSIIQEKTRAVSTTSDSSSGKSTSTITSSSKTSVPDSTSTTRSTTSSTSPSESSSTVYRSPSESSSSYPHSTSSYPSSSSSSSSSTTYHPSSSSSSSSSSHPTIRRH